MQKLALKIMVTAQGEARKTPQYPHPDHPSKPAEHRMPLNWTHPWRAASTVLILVQQAAPRPLPQRGLQGRRKHRPLQTQVPGGEDKVSLVWRKHHRQFLPGVLPLRVAAAAGWRNLCPRISLLHSLNQGGRRAKFCHHFNLKQIRRKLHKAVRRPCLKKRAESLQRGETRRVCSHHLRMEVTVIGWYQGEAEEGRTSL